MSRLEKYLAIILTVIFALVLGACMPDSEPTPTPRPTATRIPDAAPRNANVETLNAAQATLGELNFGLAPLLLEKKTTLALKDTPDGQVIRMNYPAQPVDPTAWPAVDSFVSAYAIRETLLDSSQVSRVTLGEFGVPASVDGDTENVRHVAVWVTFVDGSRATVDLTPLSTNFAPRHTPERMIVDDAQVDAEFADRRNGVDMNQLQPMLVVEQDGELYYLLAKIGVDYNQYEFWLNLYPVEPADPMRPMNLRPGFSVGMEINRTEFDKLTQLLLDKGPDIFSDQPDLLTRVGRQNEAMTQIMDDNLHLLWHLMTKLEHEPPDPTLPTPTPVPTATPSPTPTPSPTSTPRKMPLQTS